MTGELTVAVDFGTTNTVAVARRDGAAPRVVSVDGAPQLPSAVFLADDGRLVVGADALRLGRAAAHRLEPRPKSRMDEDTLLLGDTTVDVVAAVRAVLSRVCASVGGRVDHLVLTHPADWGPVRMGRLPRAAAGLATRLSLVPEPVAVAVRARLDDGAAVLVVDLGGGTSDAAVVRRDGAGFAVLACAGLPDLGGDDLDQRIVDRLRPADDPRTALRRRQDARATKELLSRHESALLSADTVDSVTLSRTDFESLVADDLARVVELAERVVAESGVDRATLRGVHLVGGTSRIPRVTELLRAALDLPVHPDPEPEAAVAWGAVDLAAATDSSATTRPVTVHSAPVRRRSVLPAVATAVVAVAVIAAAVLLPGGRDVPGRPTASDLTAPVDPTAEPAFPPVRPGTPVETPGERDLTVVPAGQSGLFVATGTYEGATEKRVEVRLLRGEIADRPAPTGYRWVVAEIEATLRVDGELPYGAGNNVHLLDDRGQLVDAVFTEGPDAMALCGPGQQSLPATPPNQPRAECAAFLVPAATPVRGVVYVDRTIDKFTAHALLFPLDLPATGPTTLPAGETRVGGPPLEVEASGAYAEVAVVDVISTPSAYFVGPPPPPGTRLHVVRFTGRPSGVGGVQWSQVADSLQLLDDRGLVVPRDDYVGYELRDCQNPYDQLPEDQPAAACLVFPLTADATIAAVIWEPRLTSGDPTRWRVWSLPD